MAAMLNWDECQFQKQPPKNLKDVQNSFAKCHKTQERILKVEDQCHTSRQKKIRNLLDKFCTLGTNNLFWHGILKADEK